MAGFKDTSGTMITDPSLEFNKQKEKADKDRFKKDRAKCINSGGTWDPVTNTCSFPIEKTKDPYKIEMPDQTEQTDKTNEPLTGANTTFNKDGTVTYSSNLGTKTVSKEEYRKQLEGKQAGLGTGDVEVDKITTPLGVKQQQARADRLQQLMQMGEQGLLNPQELQALQEAPIDWGQALTAGFMGVAPGAAGGAALGLVGSGGALSIPGAIAGAVGGFLIAVRSNIKGQQAGEIGAANRVLTDARSNLMRLRMIAEQDPSKAEDAIELYYQQIAQVQRAHRQVQLETQGNLNKFMDDGREDLARFDLFLMDGGYADLQRMRLESAVMRGTPASPEELLAAYSEYTNE